MSTPCPLLDTLPLEIRELIYRAVLDSWDGEEQREGKGDGKGEGRRIVHLGLWSLDDLASHRTLSSAPESRSKPKPKSKPKPVFKVGFNRKGKGRNNDEEGKGGAKGKPMIHMRRFGCRRPLVYEGFVFGLRRGGERTTSSNVFLPHGECLGPWWWGFRARNYSHRGAEYCEGGEGGDGEEGWLGMFLTCRKM